ncbi:MAG: hypothetical protein P8Y68_10745 [Anaerolineales bacterium]|jgi:hypothetical protein
MMKKILFVLLVALILMPATVFAAPNESNDLSVKIPNGGPKFWVSDVTRGESVTIRVAEFPKGRTYQVYIGIPGNYMSDAIHVGSLSDAKGINYSRTFNIPKEIRHQTHLAIYVWDKSDNSHGYDIFANDTGFNFKTEMSFTPVHRSSAQSAGKSVGIFNGPTVWIGKQGYPKTFNVAFNDFYDEGSYSIFIGVNNDNFPSILVGYADETNGPRFTKTFDIPDSLKDADELKVAVVNAFNGHSGSMAFIYDDGYASVAPKGFFTTTYVGDSTYQYDSKATPFTNILNVVPDGEVTLQVFNFPPDKDFIVKMGPMGTRGINGFVIGTQTSGEGGSFIATYPIPPQLYGSDYISIRMESTSSKHFVYDYFQNKEGYSADGISDPSNGDWTLSAGTHPNTQITGVSKDSTVTVTGTNFTRNDTYTVRMGAIGTQGVGGIVVDTYSTGSSRTFTATFSIPASLHGLTQIAIRFESNNTPYYAYDWFYNSDSP